MTLECSARVFFGVPRDKMFSNKLEVIPKICFLTVEPKHSFQCHNKKTITHEIEAVMSGRTPGKVPLHDGTEVTETDPFIVKK